MYIQRKLIIETKRHLLAYLVWPKKKKKEEQLLFISIAARRRFALRQISKLWPCRLMVLKISNNNNQNNKAQWQDSTCKISTCRIQANNRNNDIRARALWFRWFFFRLLNVFVVVSLKWYGIYQIMSTLDRKIKTIMWSTFQLSANDDSQSKHTFRQIKHTQPFVWNTGQGIAAMRSFIR